MWSKIPSMSKAMKSVSFFPIGTPGKPWGDSERATWRATQQHKRSYQTEVVRVIEQLAQRFDVQTYGTLDYAPDQYSLFAIRSKNWQTERPIVLVTGGVHGYETSGVHGALRFLDRHAEHYAQSVNLLVVPCVSPWAYERIHRWNPFAIDPNRSFHTPSPSAEAAALLELVAPLRDRISLHIDLHETTDSDESEFRPALCARDGKTYQPGTIPDGFYLVGDVDNPQLDFQQAVIAEVAKVTHIAQADAEGQIIGSPVVQPGVILYPCKSLGLCAAMTTARFVTTTEVYPDSPRASAEKCNAAQAAAVCAAIDFLQAHSAD